MAQNLGYLRAIVDFSKTQNIELIIFNPPKRECFCENVKAETSYLARQKIDSLLTAEHLIYYDFWRDTAFKETDFADYDHLNFEGAKKLIHRLN